MPEPLSATPAGAVLREAAVGFCGKLPARGDFVGSGLPRRFAEAWHDWLQAVLAAAASAKPSDAGADPEMCPPVGALWWSMGSPRVPRTVFATGSLPDEAVFAGMLDAGAAVSDSDFREPSR